MMKAWILCILFLGTMATLSTIAQPSSHTDNPIATNADTNQKPPVSILETGLLEAKPNFTGNVLGARIESIVVDEIEHIQIIDINAPIDPDKVDQVIVISGSGDVITQDQTARILRDYENNNVGIKIYIPKQNNWIFKLKFIDESASPSR